MSYSLLLEVLKGGAGSGNWGHAGRPGKLGGSAPKSGMGAAMSLRTGRNADQRRAMSKPTVAPDLNASSSIDMEPAAYNMYAAGLSTPTYSDSSVYGVPGWPNNVRGDVKNDICNKLSEATGLSYEAVNETIHQWAESSNNKDMRSLSMQEAAARVFGTELSDWQKSRVAIVNDPTYGYSGENKRPMFDGGDYASPKYHPYPTPQAAQDAFIKAMHTETQRMFEAAGVKTVKLYRGTRPWDAVKAEQDPFYTLSKGDKVNVKSNAMESWTIDPKVAHQFGENIIMAEVPVSRIVASARTGYGCLNEYEFVVLGGGENDQATVVSTMWKK